jgi:hypothetical protein
VQYDAQRQFIAYSSFCAMCASFGSTVCLPTGSTIRGLAREGVADSRGMRVSSENFEVAPPIARLPGVSLENGSGRVIDAILAEKKRSDHGAPCDCIAE